MRLSVNLKGNSRAAMAQLFAGKREAVQILRLRKCTPAHACRRSSAVPRSSQRARGCRSPSSKVENDLRLPPMLIAFELQIVKGHRLDLGENCVARRVEDFAGDLCLEVMFAESEDFEF